MKRRRTKNRRAVARVLLAAPDARHWGYRVMRASGLSGPQAYPVLKAMVTDGWLTAQWEDPSTVRGRSPRRYYTLTDVGRDRLAELVGPGGDVPAAPRRLRRG